MEEQTQVPAGYIPNAEGHLIPIDKVKPIDRARDELVREQVGKAVLLQDAMRRFLVEGMGDVQAFVEMSAEEYGAKLGGKKGNLSLMSYDGKYKLQVQISEHLTFDERLQVAKALIDECITRWAEGSNDNIKALINNAFDVDKEGRFNVGRILGLRKINIDDADWKQAMTAISDSVQVSGSKTYFRIYKRRESDGKYEPIALDLAAI